MLNFTNPTGKPAQENDPLVVHKYISQPLFGGGQVILRPGAEKGKQFVRQDTMVSVISLLCEQTWYHSYSLVVVTFAAGRPFLCLREELLRRIRERFAGGGICHLVWMYMKEKTD